MGEYSTKKKWRKKKDAYRSGDRFGWCLANRAHKARLWFLVLLIALPMAQLLEVIQVGITP